MTEALALSPRPPPPSSVDSSGSLKAAHGHGHAGSAPNSMWPQASDLPSSRGPNVPLNEGPGLDHLPSTPRSPSQVPKLTGQSLLGRPAAASTAQPQAHRAAKAGAHPQPPSSPVQEMESTPGPWYSTMAPVPPFTVRIPATFRITSLGEVQPEREPVSFTPIT